MARREEKDLTCSLLEHRTGRRCVAGVFWTVCATCARSQRGGYGSRCGIEGGVPARSLGAWSAGAPPWGWRSFHDGTRTLFDSQWVSSGVYIAHRGICTNCRAAASGRRYQAIVSIHGHSTAMTVRPDVRVKRGLSRVQQTQRVRTTTSISDTAEAISSLARRMRFDGIRT